MVMCQSVRRSEASKSIPENIGQSNSNTTISVRKVENKEDLLRLYNVRWKGYAKYFTSKEEIVDKCDFAPNVTLLIAEDGHRKPVGTLRILDREYGSIELDQFVDVDCLLPQGETRCAEVTRFSVPPHPQARLIKHLLWKAYLLYCMKNKINIMVMSGRPVVARAYRALLFDDLGPSGVYYHSKLGNLEHRCFICNISQKKEVLKRANRTLYDFFFKKHHPTIKKACYKRFMPKNFFMRIKLQQNNYNQSNIL
ncbi:MAG: N-acyl amino acid synthase FeeM domain-containing protein [bacterium]